MASKRATIPAKHLFNGFKRHHQPLHVTRCMATEIHLPNSTLAETFKAAPLDSATSEPTLTEETSLPPPNPLSNPIPQTTPPTQPSQNPFLTTTTCTLHSFPTLTPTALITYPSTHLSVPLRKDLLHRAVIYEGDATRQGTANTLYRTEVHGSGRKIRPQKGTGKARLGDKKSPMLRGGGVAFGPKPRDFATGLPRKVYDEAWRIALSYRYRMGQLILLSNTASLDDVHPASRVRYLRELLQHNRMGHADGRTLFVTLREWKSLFHTLEQEKMGRHARAVSVRDVDVKDLLELGRLVVEREALEWMFRSHQSDLDPRLRLGAWEGMEAGTEQRGEGEGEGEGVVEDVS